MKTFIFALTFLILGIGAVHAKNDIPLLVEGKMEVKYVTEVGLYRSVDGFWELVATAKLDDGNFCFAVDVPQTELLAIGVTQNTATKDKAIFCGKNGERIKLNITKQVGNYTLEGNVSPNNRILEAWEREYQRVLPDNDVNYTFRELYPQVDDFLKTSKEYATKVKSKDTEFDAFLKLFIETQALYGICYFHFLPSLAAPSKEERLPLLNTIGEQVKFDSPLYAKMPFCSLFLTILKVNQTVVKGKEFNLDQAADAVKATYFLSQMKMDAYRTYDDFLKDYEKYGKSIMEESQLAKIDAYKEKNGYMSAGQPAIDFTYPDIDGKMVSLSDFKGKVVVVDVWATWCAPCKKEIPHLKKLEKELEGRQDIVFLAVSVDKAKDKNTWKEMIKSEQLGGIHLFANGFSAIAESYQITAIPRFMVFDKRGNIVSTNAPRPSDPQLKKLIFNELKK